MMELGWSFHPSVLIGMGLWTTAYVCATHVWNKRFGWGRAPTRWRQLAFHFGTLAGLLALVSPLDPLGDKYLFSAHMAQHLLLMYVTAPCWVLGIPEWLPERLLPKRSLARASWVLHPLAALLVFAGITLMWHLPSLYDLAQGNEALHIFEHLCYIGAAIIGWWPILGPSTPSIPAPSAPTRMLYLFLLALPCTFLGAMLTFSNMPLYAYYAGVSHPFGMGVLEDQRLGGLLMWIPTHMILLACLAVVAGTWLNSESPRSHVS